MQSSKDTPLSLPLPVTTSTAHRQTSFIPHVSIPGYMLVSSTMLIINKVAIHLFPFPFILLSIQLFSSVLIMMTLRTLKLLDLQFVDLSKLKSYYGVVFFFLLNILSNIKALQYSNVETVIVFRTCTTLAIAYCDYRFLRLSKPSMEVVFSIVTIVLGAIIYLLMDSQLKVESIFWATLYFVIQCCEVLYVKYITSSVPMSSWTRSFYNNLIAFPFIAIAAVALGETTPLSAAFENGDINQGCVLMVGLSCGMGLLISWTGFVCREQVSATAFSVLGNVNKILTVAINCMIWDKHSSASGIAGLLLSLLGGGLYSHFASRAPTK